MTDNTTHSSDNGVSVLPEAECAADWRACPALAGVPVVPGVGVLGPAGYPAASSRKLCEEALKQMYPLGRTFR